MSADGVRVRSASRKRFVQELAARGHRWLADKPREQGGDELGPAPLELLLGSFAARTAMGILDMAREKEWAVDTVEVEISIAGTDGSDAVALGPSGGGGAGAPGGTGEAAAGVESQVEGEEPEIATGFAAPPEDLAPGSPLLRAIVVRGELNDRERRELEGDVARRWPREAWLPPGELHESFTYD